MNPLTKTDQLSPSARERVLRAMAELCAERGYRETTIAAVIERADVDADSVNSMFAGGKDQILLEATNAIMGETMSVVSGAYSADRSEWDSALVGIKAILELMAANPSYAALGYIVGRQQAPDPVRRVYETGVTVLVVMLDRLRGYGDYESQPPNAARAALGGAEALIRKQIIAGRTADLPRLLPDIVYSATVPFLGPEEAIRLARRGREMLSGTEWETEPE